MNTPVETRPCPVCGKPGRRDRPDLRIVDATCTGCGWHYTSHQEIAAESITLLTNLGMDAARSAWAKHARHAPRYPAIEMWLALAAHLRGQDKTELLDHEGHRVFVGAYEQELKALTARGDACGPR